MEKFCKLTMLTMLFFTALGLGVTSIASNQVDMPIKQAVSYSSSDDLNDHDTSHSSNDSWTSFHDVITSAGGTLPGGSNTNGMLYYYLEEDVTFTTSNLSISGYVTLCLNGKTITGNSNDSVISVSSGAYFNLCDCSGNDSGTIKGGKASYYGGGVYVNERATFNMYGGSISNNEAEEGGGVYIYESTFNMYGGTISGNFSLLGGGVTIGGSGYFNMYNGTILGNNAPNGGGVDVYPHATFIMYNGTLSNNTASENGGGVYVENDGTFNMYGGYFGNDMYRYSSGTISIKGGYFSSSIYESIRDYIDSDYIGVNISTLGTDLDNNYVDGYPYAVYATSITEYSVSDATDITYGSTYTPTINTDSNLYTSVAYTYKDGDNEILGLPTEIGEYTVTAHFLYTTTEGYITNNSYGTAEFKVTILSSSSTSSDGEDGTDNNLSDSGTTTSTDSTGLSAGAIAGIVIASVFVVGLIAFLVYFFVFRKKKANKEEKKSNKKTKK